MSNTDTNHAWWSRLRHQGMLLSPVVMLERYADAPEAAPFHKVSKLRDAYTRFVSTTEGRGDDPVLEESAILSWVDAVLQHYVGYEKHRLAKQGSIPENLTTAVRIGSRTDTIKPNRVIFADDLGLMPAILVMADTSPHVGRGRGRTVYAKFLELLRGTGHRLGLLTNGFQFRLVYAGLDFESWCEWEVERWFDDGEGSQELAGLRQLLSADSLKPVREKVQGLLDAVEESRKRQADLSSVLRENVRQAVELLTEEVSAAHRTDGRLFELLFVTSSAQRLTDVEAHEALMQASVRIVMRMVVCLFAESRQLLPVNDPIYAQSYGVRTLYELLDEAVRQDGGTHALLTRQTAWPRLMALFRLIYGGSAHGSFTLRAYGGALFRPGKAGDVDHVSRALDLLERHVAVTDATVFAVLRKLLRGPLPVIRGRSKTYVDGPVDYTDLRTEFIGLIYEGLLDYRLKRTDEATGPQIFLNLGREPVLPLSRLQEMLANDPKGLKDLLTTLRKEKVTASLSSEAEEEKEDADDAADEDDEADAVTELIVESTDVDVVPRPRDAVEDYNAAIEWAKQSVVLAELVSKQGKKQPNAEYQSYLEDEAKKLISKVVAIGDFYLVRAGNTRKGSGTFYTPPQLAVPTVHRTLEPLCYAKQADATLVPRTPDVILALKVCDPACGSASMLVAGLHYLTEALYKSLCHHCDLDNPAHSTQMTLPFGKSRTGTPGEEFVPFPPNDPQQGDHFADRVKAILRRHVVERCIYGVDINPLAVEFARVSLWIETLDPELPFSFLDHKIKVGNALVGCWLNRVLDYPLKAWEREGGDGKDGVRTGRIETFLRGAKGAVDRRTGDGIIKQEMRQLIEQRFQGQSSLFGDASTTVQQVIQQAQAIYEIIHSFSVNDAESREYAYRQQFEDNPRFKKLKASLDEWCAIWFWPTDEESITHVPTPLTFHRPTPERNQIVERISKAVKFFHWEIAFPDVFTSERSGFDGLLGNPPWDVIQPNSQEFFTEFDPLYRGYDKQEALKKQAAILASSPSITQAWDDYNEFFKSLSNWTKGVSDPFDVALSRGKQGKDLSDAWTRFRRSEIGFSEARHPFCLLGNGKQNAYKLFMEMFWTLLRPNGRLGIILPTGIYSDLGTTVLREQLLLHGQLDLLYAFQNERLIFSTATHSYKQAVVIASRGGTTAQFRTRFRMGVGDSPAAHDIPQDILRGDALAMTFTLADLRSFSPKTLGFVEFKSVRDLTIFRKIYASSIRIGEDDPNWSIRFGQEFNLTSNSKLFPPLEKWTALGYRADVFGRWKNPDGEIALPLFEGSSIFQFDPSYQGWSSGHGASSIWDFIPFDHKTFKPRFLIGQSSLNNTHTLPKVVYRAVARNNLTRTMTSAVISQPSGNSLSVLTMPGASVSKLLELQSLLNSFCFDFVLRARIAGLNVNWFALADCPLAASKNPAVVQRLIITSARLSLIHRRFAPAWLSLKKAFPELRSKEWKQWWAVTEADRLRLRAENDSLAALQYGLDSDDFTWIVRDDPSDPKGFYRVDRQLPFGERLTGVASAAFRALKDGKWFAESAGELTNDEFFEVIGIPELTSDKAAKALELDRPLIYKRNGCHAWEPEKFTKDDARYGWTWDHCWQDAVALLGSEQAVKDYVNGRSEAVPERESQGKNWLRSDPVETQGKLF